MTDADWLACEDPVPMLTFLAGRASGRKLRLFACACCRRVRAPFTEAVGSAEAFTDGRAEAAALASARSAASAAAGESTDSYVNRCALAAAHSCSPDIRDAAQHAAESAAIAAAWLPSPPRAARRCHDDQA